MKASERLQRRIISDLGLVCDVPFSVNRGYWHTGRDVYRWAVDIEGEWFFSYLPMAVAVHSRLGVERDGIGGQNEIGRMVTEDEMRIIRPTERVR